VIFSDGERQAFRIPQRRPPEFLREFALKTEGAGKAGCKPHPQPHAQDKKAHELVTTGSTGAAGFPRAIGFNGFLRALPGEPGFIATIAGHDAQASRPA